MHWVSPQRALGVRDHSGVLLAADRAGSVLYADLHGDLAAARFARSGRKHAGLSAVFDRIGARPEAGPLDLLRDIGQRPPESAYTCIFDA